MSYLTCILYKQKFNHLIHNNIKSKLMPQLTAFSFSTWESVLSSPNSAKNAWVDLNLSGSRKLSRLWSSSVLFWRGVPDSRTWCSCNKHLDEFSMKTANLFLSQPFELKVHCLPYNRENLLAKLISLVQNNQIRNFVSSFAKQGHTIVFIVDFFWKIIIIKKNV